MGDGGKQGRKNTYLSRYIMIGNNSPRVQILRSLLRRIHALE